MFLINYIAKMMGSVKISIEGFFIEKFINICTHRNIKLNNIKRLNGCILHSEVSIRDFRLLKDICRKTKCRLKILDKKGIPFILHRYRKRKLVIIAIFLIICAIIYLNTLIWQVNVNCDNPQVYTQVNRELENMGISKYTSKYKWDIDYIKNEMMLRIENITWMEMDFRGVVLQVDIKTGNLPPQLVNETETCNIVATKTGVIDRIIVKNGLKVANVGDIVEEGDMLITGLITSDVVEDYYINAEGEVYAKVWYSKIIQVPLKEEKYIYTGNKKTFVGTKFINKKLFFGKVSTNYKEYDTILKEKRLRVFNMALPIKVYEYTYYEKQTQNIDRTYEEALEYGLKILEPMIMEQIPKDSQIVDKRNSSLMVNSDLQIELIFECIEQIGTKQLIT